MCTSTFLLLHLGVPYKFKILNQNPSLKVKFCPLLYNFPLSFLHLPYFIYCCLLPRWLLSPPSVFQFSYQEPSSVMGAASLISGHSWRSFEVKNWRTCCAPSLFQFSYYPDTARARGKGKNASPKRLPAFVDVWRHLTPHPSFCTLFLLFFPPSSLPPPRPSAPEIASILSLCKRTGKQECIFSFIKEQKLFSSHSVMSDPWCWIYYIVMVPIL